jgi:hypothetical protein
VLQDLRLRTAGRCEGIGEIGHFPRTPLLKVGVVLFRDFPSLRLLARMVGWLSAVDDLGKVEDGRRLPGRVNRHGPEGVAKDVAEQIAKARPQTCPRSQAEHADAANEKLIEGVVFREHFGFQVPYYFDCG